MPNKDNEDELVFPGDRLCVIEEYLPGFGTYEDSTGNIRSQVIGLPIYDRKGHVVSIKKVTQRLILPQKGNVVLARVMDVKGSIASAKIFAIEGRSTRSTYLFSGLLHISKITTSFLRSIYDAIRICDVIRAQVLTSTPPYLLSIKGKDFGVVLAYCSSCLSPLILRNMNLYCTKCKRSERRKVAYRYYIRMRS